MQSNQIKPATDPLLPSFLNGIHVYAYAYARGVLHRVMYLEKCRYGLKSHIGYITAQQSAPVNQPACLPACHTAVQCTALHCIAWKNQSDQRNLSSFVLSFARP